MAGSFLLSQFARGFSFGAFASFLLLKPFAGGLFDTLAGFFGAALCFLQFAQQALGLALGLPLGFEQIQILVSH